MITFSDNVYSRLIFMHGVQNNLLREICYTLQQNNNDREFNTKPVS